MENEASRPQASTAPSLPSRSGRGLRWLGALLAALVLFGGVFELVRRSISNGQARTEFPNNPPEAPKPFAGWNNPDFVLVISGQMYGYLQPCGCSFPQYGGL